MDNFDLKKYLAEGKLFEEVTRLKVWVNPRKKSTIELKADQLRDAVSSGHDNDWNWNIQNISSNIKDGDTEGETKIDRYGGGGSDTVYWQLLE